MEALIASVLTKSTDQSKGKLLAPTIKKSRSKLAADWIAALVEGKSFDDPDGPMPELEKKASAKRKPSPAKGPQKKARKEPPPIDKDSIQANPKTYIGCRVAKYFDDELYFGKIRKYTAQNLADDPESVDLWQVRYDDNDEEEYDIEDMIEYLTLYETHRGQDPKA